jgi:hypothetical protein
MLKTVPQTYLPEKHGRVKKNDGNNHKLEIIVHYLLPSISGERE